MESAADNIGINPLGSGSDYTVFLQYIGVRNVQEAVEFDLMSVQVASSEAGFTSTLHDPVYHYHSVFDSQHWQEVYGDPGFSRHVCFGITLDSAELDYLLRLQLLSILASKFSAFPVTSSYPSTLPTILWSYNHTLIGVYVHNYVGRHRKPFFL